MGPRTCAEPFPFAATDGSIAAVTPLWSGTAVALATLFDDDGGLAADATAQHAARLVEAGIRAVLVNGSTGEAAALTDDERVELVRPSGWPARTCRSSPALPESGGSLRPSGPRPR